METDMDNLREAIQEHRMATIYAPREHGLNENPVRPWDERLWATVDGGATEVSRHVALTLDDYFRLHELMQDIDRAINFWEGESKDELAQRLRDAAQAVAAAQSFLSFNSGVRRA